MKILFFCPIWGSEKLSLEDFVQRVKDAGYDGVETSLPMDAEQKSHILNTLENAGLSFIAQHWETSDVDFATHKLNFEKRLRNLIDTNPLYINSQTGKDHFPFEYNCELVELSHKIADEAGVRILHETHRGKFSFAAHIARRYLEHFEDLRLGLDISHWFTVAESLLEDQEQAVSLALSRTDHIHARVGFPEGPQIPDPRVDRWQEVLDRHIQLWDQVIENARVSGREFFTITPEFGPEPYMQVHPETNLPLANQWDVNVYMKDLLNERYNG